MAPSLFGGKKVEPVQAAPEPVPTIPREPVEQQFDRLVVDEEPLDSTSRKRSCEELFQIIKDLLTRRFQDVERGFQELDELNTRRLSQELMYQLLKR